MCKNMEKHFLTYNFQKACHQFYEDVLGFSPDRRRSKKKPTKDQRMDALLEQIRAGNVPATLAEEDAKTFREILNEASDLGYVGDREFLKSPFSIYSADPDGPVSKTTVYYALNHVLNSLNREAGFDRNAVRRVELAYNNQ